MSIKPKLGLFDTTVIVISLIIGIGIFRTPSIVASETQDATLFFLAWLTGGIICLIGGLIFAEIGSRKPIAGGFYKLVSEAYHPAFAFMLNWLGITITSSATYAAVAVLGSEYITQLIPIEGINSPSGIKLTAVSIILFLFIINYTGIKSGAGTLNILTAIKILLILFFSLLAFSYSSQPEVAFVQDESCTNPLYSFTSALIAVFFTVGGYQLTINLAADVKNPRRNLPLGIITGVIITIILYILINTGYYSVMGIIGIANSPLIAADTANIIFGQTGKAVISVLIFISAVGFINVSLMHVPRTYHAMAEDKVLPEIFMRVNKKTQTQEFTLLIMCILITVFIIFLGEFEKIINLIIFLDSLAIAVVASTIFIFRKRKDENMEYTGFKIPFFPVLPVIFIFFLLIVSINAFYRDITAGLISIVVFITGFPIYKTLRRIIK
ncbi:MAG: amino acid permease [Ignavibacteria bacterium]|nr:amino acid permease [Ignavibacteria bacterium]